MPAVAAFSPQRHRLTVDQYYRMAEAGIFKEDDRVELIEGEIIDMPPIGIDHAYFVNRLTSLFIQSVGLQANVSSQNPIRLNSRSEPQPDPRGRQHAAKAREPERGGDAADRVARARRPAPPGGGCRLPRCGGDAPGRGPGRL